MEKIELGNPVRNEVWYNPIPSYSTMGSIFEVESISTWNSVWTSVWNSVRDSVWDSVWDSTRISIRRKLLNGG